jgi:hypothetical protein
MPEARMLGLLALLPHTTGVYEQLPLLLIPRTGRAFALLFGLSYLAAGLVYTRNTFGPSVSGTLDAQWPYFLVLVYLPALVMVLASRKPRPDASGGESDGPVVAPPRD